MTTPEKPHLLCLDLKRFVATVTVLIEIGAGVGLFGLWGGLCAPSEPKCVMSRAWNTHCRKEIRFWGLNMTTLMHLTTARKTTKMGTRKQGSEQSQPDFWKNRAAPQCKDKDDSKAIIKTLSKVKPIVFFHAAKEHQPTMSTAGNRLQMKGHWGFFVKLRASVGPQVSAEQYSRDMEERRRGQGDSSGS